MSYYLGSYWYDRPLSIEDSARKISDYLFLLEKSDTLGLFQNWFELGKSMDEALKNKVELFPDNIQSLLIKFNKLKKKIGITPFFVEKGFRLSIWNGSGPDKECSIAFSLGGSGSVIPNSCVLYLPDSAFEGDLNSLFKQSVLFWEPKWATITSHIVSDKLQSANKIGLMNYYSNDFVLPNSLAKNTKIDDIQIGKIISVGNSLSINGTDTIYLDNLQSLFQSIQELNPKW